LRDLQSCVRQNAGSPEAETAMTIIDLLSELLFLEEDTRRFCRIVRISRFNLRRFARIIYLCLWREEIVENY
jgi:hypothetical protein